MTFSTTFIRNMERALLRQYLSGGPTYLADSSIANKYARSIVIKKEDIIYVPFMMECTFDRSLGKLLANGDCDSIEFPLYDETYSNIQSVPTRVFRSTENIMAYLLNAQSGIIRLCEINTNSTVYHMSPTMIFNNEWELIYYVTLEYKLQRYARQDSEYVCTNNAKMFISPTIFKKEGMLEKIIVNKVIPYYTNKDDRDKTFSSHIVRVSTNEINFLKGLTITAEIKDLSHIIENNVERPKLNYNEEINDMIAEHASELADCMTAPSSISYY